MGKVNEEWITSETNNIQLPYISSKPKGMINMDLWIKRHFDTQDKLDKFIGHSIKTSNRWMNHTPQKFLEHLPELATHTGQEPQEIIDMILQRERDVQTTK